MFKNIVLFFLAILLGSTSAFVALLIYSQPTFELKEPYIAMDTLPMTIPESTNTLPSAEDIEWLPDIDIFADEFFKSLNEEEQQLALDLWRTLQADIKEKEATLIRQEEIVKTIDPFVPIVQPYELQSLQSQLKQELTTHFMQIESFSISPSYRQKLLSDLGQFFLGQEVNRDLLYVKSIQQAILPENFFCRETHCVIKNAVGLFTESGFISDSTGLANYLGEHCELLPISYSTRLDPASQMESANHSPSLSFELCPIDIFAPTYF